MKFLAEKNWDKIVYDIFPDHVEYKKRLKELETTDPQRYSALFLLDSELEHAYNREDLLDKINQLNEIGYPIGTIYRKAPNATNIDVTKNYKKYFK